MRKTHRLMLVIVLAAILLGIGAVSAYAGLADDAQLPVTTTDVGASYWNDAVVTLTATDNEGIAYIYHEFDEGVVRLSTVDGKPLTADLAVPTVKDQPLSAGTHKLKYWAQDVNGNVEAQHTVTFTVVKDVAAPVTTATGATHGGWYRKTVAVHLVAADEAGGSGLAMISWAVDAGTPTMVPGAFADAGLTVGATTPNGSHDFTFQAVDVAGNAEALRTLTVNIDTKKPTTSAPSAASVVKGRTATLKYKVTDAAPNGGKATVVIKVKSRSGKVVKTIKAGKVAVNKTLYAKFSCSLARGTYTFSVYATDMAGNAQAKIGSNKLTVK